jgi:hypothetical protein
MMDSRPGLNQKRLIRLMEAAVTRCRLNLSGVVTLTEAASGAYVVTPILAAMAGADRVFAMTRTTRYGTFDAIRANTLELAKQVGVDARIEVIFELTAPIVRQADIITNSGHLRPIDAKLIGWMKPGAVAPLMYESWEYRAADLDLGECNRRGILVAGTNERHPAVNVFSFLGDMAIKQLLDMGVAVSASRLLLICDNEFGPYIERGLNGAGGKVTSSPTLDGALSEGPFDAVVLARTPQAGPVLTATDALEIAARWPGAPLAQYWGDVDRDAFMNAGVPVWPPSPPAAGHMAILPSEIGPEPIVNLQCGGLKVGEVLLRSAREDVGADKDFLDPLIIKN